MISDLKHLARTTLTTLRILPKRYQRFRGVFADYKEAMNAIRPGTLAGYNHSAAVPINFEEMCKLRLRDYPVLFWLQKLEPQIKCLLDAGGHMGTTYRAFDRHLSDISGIHWVIYDVPAMARAGRERALADGLSGLSFVEALGDAPAADLLLASGLLQYLDIPFAELLGRLPSLPPHLLLNKVATRDGPTIVTLENLGPAETPYQIRDRAEFELSLHALGYAIRDQWVIPELSHAIPLHGSFGASTSRGYYATLRK
jgi:putative methyltransferase (TIGR04325 family)